MNQDIMNTPAIPYVETDFRDFASNRFTASRLEAGLDCFCVQQQFVTIPKLHSVLMEIMSKLSPTDKFITTAITPHRFNLVGQTAFLVGRTSPSATFVEVMGDQMLCDQVLDEISKTYAKIAVSVDWMVGGDIGSITVPLVAPTGILDSNYPFIEEGVEKFVDDFYKSTENVMLLIGPPGTGKSNFVKYLVARSDKGAIVTYDPEIMKRDSMFATFIEGDYGSLIMEDADNFLGSRREGNEQMSRMLNVGDGLVSMYGKKIIFSTNLESTSEVDSALLRPGRCYAVVHFRKFTYAESKKFLAEHNLTGWKPVKGEEYTLAELYNNTKRARQVVPKRKIGFI